MSSDQSRKDGAGGDNPVALRRSFLGAGVSVGLLAGRGWAQSDPAHERPKEGDLLVRGDNPGAAPLNADDLETGAVQIMAWPMDPRQGRAQWLTSQQGPAATAGSGGAR